jgi:hypothetical protein
VMDRGTNKAHAYLPPGDVWLDVWTTQRAPAQGPRVRRGPIRAPAGNRTRARRVGHRGRARRLAGGVHSNRRRC